MNNVNHLAAHYFSQSYYFIYLRYKCSMRQRVLKPTNLYFSRIMRYENNLDKI